MKKKISKIIQADRERRIVVVSAPGKRDLDDTKITDLLIDIARKRLEGNNYEHSVSEVVNRYNDIANDLHINNKLVVRGANNE